MIKIGAKGVKRTATSAAAVAAVAAATKSCPDGKEINPITGRCVNICKVGTIRNATTGKCDKIPNVNNVRKGRPKKKTPPRNNTQPKKSLSPIVFSSPSPHSQRSQHSQHKSSSVSSPSSKSFELYYPDLDDPEFTIKIANNKEFLIHKIPEFPVINNVKEFDEISNKLCGKFDKMLYQHFVSQYISYRTPYKSILLYHGVGVGKTCSAITISEALLSSQTTSEPMIWVIMPQSLKNSFKSQVFNIDDFDTFESLSNQCTDHNYIKLLNIYKSTFDNNNNKGIKEYREKLKSELKAILKTRYDIFTYDRFAKYIKERGSLYFSPS